MKRRPFDMRAILAADRGLAVVEFALLSPLMILVLLLAVDFGVAFNMQLRLLSAVAAGAQYIQNNGTALTASGFSRFADSVETVVKQSADLVVTPTVSVAVNNTADGSAAGGYYCVDGSPPTFTQMASAGSSCGNDVTAGKYVTLKVALSLSTVFPTDPVVGTVFPLHETIIVRVK